MLVRREELVKGEGETQGIGERLCVRDLAEKEQVTRCRVESFGLHGLCLG